MIPGVAAVHRIENQQQLWSESNGILRRQVSAYLSAM
jgi:hypothetical protein